MARRTRSRSDISNRRSIWSDIRATREWYFSLREKWNALLSQSVWSKNCYFSLRTVITCNTIAERHWLKLSPLFRTKWSFKRFLRYPLSSIPNLILTSLFICLFSGIIGIDPYISYVLAPICALPIMFFIIRFLVKPIKGKKVNKKKVYNKHDK